MTGKVSWMTDETRYFLFVRNLSTDDVHIRDLGTNSEYAMGIYAETEKTFLETPENEVIMFGAPSLESLRETHANWFPGWRPELTLS